MGFLDLFKKKKETPPAVQQPAKLQGREIPPVPPDMPLFSFERDRQKIYPCIKPDETSTALKITEKDGREVVLQMPNIDFLAGLRVYFVGDMGPSFQILQQSMVPEGMTAEELFQLAVENLNRDIQVGLADRGEGVYQLQADPDHAASFLLSGIWDQIAGAVGDDLRIMAPARETVLLCGKSNTQAAQRIEELAAQAYANSRKPMSRKWMYYSREQHLLSEDE